MRNFDIPLRYRNGAMIANLTLIAFIIALAADSYAIFFHGFHGRLLAVGLLLTVVVLLFDRFRDLRGTREWRIDSRWAESHLRDDLYAQLLKPHDPRHPIDAPARRRDGGTERPSKRQPRGGN